MRNSTKHQRALDQGTARRRYKPTDLARAVEGVKTGAWSVNYAALMTRVPTRTIYRQSQPGSSTRCGPAPILSACEEQKLVDHIFTMSDLALGLTKYDAVKIVLKLVSDGRKHPWQAPGSSPGRDWWAGFLGRHPEVVMRANEKLEKARAQNDRPDVMLN
jgi:hypothetical protein